MKRTFRSLMVALWVFSLFVVATPVSADGPEDGKVPPTFIEIDEKREVRPERPEGEKAPGTGNPTRMGWVNWQGYWSSDPWVRSKLQMIADEWGCTVNVTSGNRNWGTGSWHDEWRAADFWVECDTTESVFWWLTDVSWTLYDGQGVEWLWHVGWGSWRGGWCNGNVYPEHNHLGHPYNTQSRSARVECDGRFYGNYWWW